MKGVYGMADNERGGLFGCGFGTNWIWIIIIILVIILLFPAIFGREEEEGYYKE
jgi:uncharacterized membrane protein